MKKNIITILISNETIQNVLFIKEFIDDNTEILMLSTKDMEKKRKSEHIKETLEHKYKFHTIIVDAFSSYSILQELSKFEFDNYDKKIVNITGGTKLMSIETSNFFKSVDNSEVYYVINGGQFIKIHSQNEQEVPQNFNATINIKEYFKSYGFNTETSRLSGIDKEFTYSFFEWFINDKTTYQHSVINELRENTNNENFKRTKKLNTEKIKGLDSLIAEINFPISNKGIISLKEARYLAGGWFEEYVYYKIIDSGIVNENSILCGVKKINDISNNEFDIVYLKNNKLYAIECKTYIISNNKDSLVNDTIYKLDSIIKELGIHAKPYIATLNEKSSLNQSNIKRAKHYNIDFLTLEDFREDGFLDILNR